ncbi:hypothetical protein N9N28_02245 [Rubripirellula amarantea]|nr:hypothetical protein [Rubripirellula amarantea]
MRSLFTLIFWVTLTLPALAGEPVDFVRDVFPILETYCIGCHTSEDASGEFVMETHAAMMQGGENGVAITAGVPKSSRMFLMAAGKMEPIMPPDDQPGLTEDELAILEAWIEQGAIGPDGDMPIKRELRIPKIAVDEQVVLPVTAIAIAPDGMLRAIARFDRVEIVDAKDHVVTTLKGEFGKVNSLRFNRDGSKVLIASGLTGAYGLASIYSVSDGELVREMVGHRDTIYSAVFDPDEKRVATAGYDHEIILWDATTGEPIRKFTGHNGAIYDLAFSPDGEVIVSACADETLKVWNVESGERLDTLGQPEGEVFAVEVTRDGKYIIAGSRDNRLRVWKLVSRTEPRTNPLVATRFVDESPIVNFVITPDGSTVVVLSEAGNLKTISTNQWVLGPAIESLPSPGSDLCVLPSGKSLLVSLMTGQTVTREVPDVRSDALSEGSELSKVYLDLGPLAKVNESESASVDQSPITIPRGAEISGTVSEAGEVDVYSWHANRGEVWAIDADALTDSRIDPIVSIHDQQGAPVLRTRLQAIRDTYFTFRGKDSVQVNDFRLFNYEEIHLNDYLYASGEVTRMWLHPRGPDSGFNVYPNEASRWTYFGTSHTTHALGEPAYVVRQLAEGELPVANGLPVFDIYYENDDDPRREAGNASRIIFTAPVDGLFQIQISDTRGEGGQGYGYRVQVRAAEPMFEPSVEPITAELLRGAGRELTVRVKRLDDFEGPVEFHVQGLPEGLVTNFPLTIEESQRYAHGTVWVPEAIEGWEGEVEPTLVASAQINGRVVERHVGSIGKLKLGGRPQAVPRIEPVEKELIQVSDSTDWTLQVRRGETVSARLVLDRQDSFNNEVSFGKEGAGRNTAFGVIVDNIGLNGLLLLAGETEREFFITADPTSPVGKRSFFLTANVNGGITTAPITVEVLP